jgi:hypothetical protein
VRKKRKKGKQKEKKTEKKTEIRKSVGSYGLATGSIAGLFSETTLGPGRLGRRAQRALTGKNEPAATATKRRAFPRTTKVNNRCEKREGERGRFWWV